MQIKLKATLKKECLTAKSLCKINLGGTRPTDLAYQVGIGAKFKLSKNAGIFAEAGYGKYIVQGGVFFKF